MGMVPEQVMPGLASSKGSDGLTDAQRAKQVKDSGYIPPAPTAEDTAAQAKAKMRGNNAPLLGAGSDATDAPAKALQSPTLTDILMRDIVSGQVRTMRKGGRRGTFSGTAQSPYGTLPPLGG